MSKDFAIPSTELMYYLNPLVESKSPFKHFKYNSFSDLEFNVLKILLKSTNREQLSIECEALSSENALEILFEAYNNTQVKKRYLKLGTCLEVNDDNTPTLQLVLDTVTEEQVQSLVKLIQVAQFQHIAINVKNCNAPNALTLLRAISGNSHTKTINIKIPEYNVDSLQALKEYIFNLNIQNESVSQQPSIESDLQELTEMFGQLLVTTQNKLQELKENTTRVSTNVLASGRTYLSQFSGFIQQALSDSQQEELQNRSEEVQRTVPQ